MLLCQEIQRKDVIFCSFHRVAEAGQRDFDQANEVMSTWAHFIPDFEDESELLQFVNHIWWHHDRELWSVAEVRLRVAIHDVASELLESRERLIADIEITLWQVELYSCWFILTVLFVLSFLSFTFTSIGILSL